MNKNFKTNQTKHWTLAFLLLLLVWQVVLGAGRKIDKIIFSKVDFKGDQSLEEIINSKEGKLYEPRLVKLDRILLTNYFKNYGFLNVDVRDSVVLDPRKNKVKLYYLIDLGKRYYFGGVRFSGLETIPLKKLETAFKNLRIGEPFREAQISEAIRKVEDIFYNSGKPYVNIDPQYLYEQDSLIFLYLTIKENATVYIADIQYEGLKMCQKFLVRRELEIKKGDRYNRQALNKSQQNLYATGLFRYVRFDLEPLSNDSSRAVLRVLVQEKEARWVGFRLGVAHDQDIYFGNKVELTLQGGHRNLFGTGRSISLFLTPSFYYDFGKKNIINPDNRATLVFVEPWMFYTRTPGVFQLAFEQYRPVNSAHFNLYRGSFDVHKVFSRGVEMSGGLSARQVDIIKQGTIDTTLISPEQVRKSAVYSLSFFGKRDKRKNIFNPYDGSYSDVSLSFSYSRGKNEAGINEINRYITLTASWQRYQPFRPKLPHFKRRNFTFATRLKIGAIFEPFGNKEIPIDDRFFAGGATTVRGYHEQLLGPAAGYDKNGKIVRAAGGKALFIANAELRIPLFWLLVMETFVDAGNVWAELNQVNPLEIKPTTGFGLALLTPLGPVRVDLGYKLLPKKSDPSRYAIHAGLYFAF